MKLGKVFKIFIVALVALAVCYLLFRFIKKRWFRKVEKEKEEAPDTGEVGDTDNEEESVAESVSVFGSGNTEKEKENLEKWKDFKYSKKLNEVKLNNDIVISENDKLDNPDFEEIFSAPYENTDGLFDIDDIKNKVQLQDDDYCDTIVNKNDEIDINQLDSIENFSSRIKDIEKQLISQPIVEEPKIKLIDNEFFGW